MNNFKFGFSAKDDGQDLSSSVLDSTNCDSELEWFTAKEVFGSECKDLTINEQQQTFKVNNFKIQYICHTKVDDSATGKNIIEEDDHSDLIPARYEGGMKIWECTFDLASYLTSSEKPVNLEKKSVLDLGCGVGVIGLVALRLGAKAVHFQDYNEDVLRQATIPNVSLNSEEQFLSCKFYSGDWASFSDLDDLRYDVILTCETIYNIQNNRKLHNTLRKKLKNDGVVLLAAKTYYFGVGGGTRLFESLVEEEGVFSSTVCWKCSTGVHREILKLKFKDAT